jgi:hypothetical protein
MVLVTSLDIARYTKFREWVSNRIPATASTPE